MHFLIIGISLFYNVKLDIYTQNMNYIITAAGKGTRLIKSGIKPLNHLL